MELCLISPTSGLEKYATLSKRHLVLAHIKDEAYQRFYYERKQAGDFLILDNGAHEHGASVDWNRLERSIAYYKPDVCVLPDVLNDRRKTLSSSLRFLDKQVDRWGCEWMFVPQGRNWSEALLSILDDKRVGHLVSWVGVTRYLSIDQGRQRVEVAKWIKNSLPGLNLHALGMVKGSVEEYVVVRDSNLFESLDTSVPIWRGWKGYSLYASWPEISVDFSATYSSTNEALIKSNLEVLDVDITQLQ